MVCGYYTLYFWDIIRFYIHPTNPPNAPRSLAYHEDTDIFIFYFSTLYLLPALKSCTRHGDDLAMFKKEYKLQIKLLGIVTCLLCLLLAPVNWYFGPVGSGANHLGTHQTVILRSAR